MSRKAIFTLSVLGSALKPDLEVDGLAGKNVRGEPVLGFEQQLLCLLSLLQCLEGTCDGYRVCRVPYSERLDAETPVRCFTKSLVTSASSRADERLNNSGAFFAEMLLRPPRKLFIYIIKYKHL